MKIRKSALAVAVAALVTGSAIGANGSNNGSTNNAGQEFRARLTASQEGNQVTGATARANAFFRLSGDGTKLRFTLQIANGTDITEAHLHCGRRGVDGPVIVPLIGLLGPASAPLSQSELIQGGFSGNLNITATLTDADIVKYSNLDNATGAGMAGLSQGCSAFLSHGQDITTLTQLADAVSRGEIYVNVHSVAHPEGEIRGQVRLIRSGGGNNGSNSNNSGTGGGSGTTTGGSTITGGGTTTGDGGNNTGGSDNPGGSGNNTGGGSGNNTGGSNNTGGGGTTTIGGGSNGGGTGTTMTPGGNGGSGTVGAM